MGLLCILSIGVSLFWFIPLQPANSQQNMWAFWALQGVVLRKDAPPWLKTPGLSVLGLGQLVSVFGGQGQCSGLHGQRRAPNETLHRGGAFLSL